MSISSVKTGAIGDSLLAGNAAYNPTSFESIASATGTGSNSVITFSSIPGTYKSLQIRSIARSTTSGTTDNYIRLNSDTGANYTYHRMRGDGASATAFGLTGLSSVSASYTTGDTGSTGSFGAMVMDIHDYASTTKYKTVRLFNGLDNNGSGSVVLMSSLWLSTSAVSTITITAGSGNFASGTVYALYGIN